MATWLWSALAHGETESPLHIGSEYSISILELAQIVTAVSGEVLNYVPEILVAKEIDFSESIHKYVPANSVTRKVLDVSEWTSLAEMIKQTMLHATT
jgi:nucleoside-diphosphate-sugar epimerase